LAFGSHEREALDAGATRRPRADDSGGVIDTFRGDGFLATPQAERRIGLLERFKQKGGLMKSTLLGALVTLLTVAGAATAAPPPTGTAPAGSAPPGNWSLISTWVVSTDTMQTIPVGAARGEWARLYLRGGQTPVNVLDVKVTFADGREQTIPVRAVLPMSGNSR
jgi:hypothetical protein